MYKAINYLSDKAIIQFKIEYRFIIFNFSKKSRIILIKLIVIKFILFKFKIVLIDFESNKFIFENNTIILLIENIDIDFNLTKILRIVTIEFLL